MNRFFATCPRGLEALLADELQALGASEIRTTDGGAAFGGEFTLCYRVNLESRIATRVLWQVAHGRYASADDLYQAAYRLDWPQWFDVGLNFMVKVTGVKCPLPSLDFATLRIKDAVCDRFRQVLGRRPSIDTREPDVRVHAYLAAETYQLYLDTSGHALYQRGLRRASVEAPLRENLAAGILRLSGWQPGMALLDPMCGSGTFLLEAAMMALDIAPGSQRRFGFEKLNGFAADTWAELRAQALRRARAVTFQQIYGSDHDPRALRASRQNLQQAGLLEAVQLARADVTAVTAPAAHGVLVANPPYGVRIGDDAALAELYPQLGRMLKQQFAGWTACFLTSDLRLPKLMRLAPGRRTPLYNGPLECRLFEFKMVAGSNRREKPHG